MKSILSKFINKLFLKRWIIGVLHGNIEDIIRTKTFEQNIKWVQIKSLDTYYADPFILNSDDKSLKILLEDFSIAKGYGKIASITLDKSFNQVNHKILLDTKSHISYPFIFSENNKTYVFPEAGRSGKLSCYEYDPVNESLVFLKDILELPLSDSTIFKKDNRYWIFGTLSDEITGYKLHVYHSESLLGPYVSHPSNPISSGRDGLRAAGNFIKVDGAIYRPTQNCKNKYGESMTINKITELSETSVAEEPYMTICINKEKRLNDGMHSIHTLNVSHDIIVVDGEKWTFSPLVQLRNFIKYRNVPKL